MGGHIFNISLVLSTFGQKKGSKQGNVKDCVLLGGHIFNISPVLSKIFPKMCFKTEEMLKMFDLIFEKNA